MKAYLDCYPCFLRQALSASRRGGADPEQQMAVIRRSLAMIENLEPEATPPQIAHRVHGIVRDEIGAADPYRQAKEESTRQALAVPVVYTVKKGPIINDATVKDAQAAGLNRIATVIDNSTDAPGTV